VVETCQEDVTYKNRTGMNIIMAYSEVMFDMRHGKGGGGLSPTKDNVRNVVL